MEEIVAVRTFRSRLPVRRVRHMDRRGQEVQNNFPTDHIIKVLSGTPVRSPKGRQKRSERPSADRSRAVSDTIARDRRFFPSWTLFAVRSLHLYRSTRETNNVITNRIVDTFGHLDNSLELIVDPGKYWIAMDGIGGLRQVPAQGPPQRPFGGLARERLKK